MRAAAVAAYCSACNAYVFLSDSGDCEFGHPRSSLRSLYIAEADARTGKPIPPNRSAQAPIRGHVKPPINPPNKQVPSASDSPMPVKQPRAPMIHDVAGSAIWPTDFMGFSALTRLLNSPRGKHSASPDAPKPPRGRHSAGANGNDKPPVT